MEEYNYKFSQNSSILSLNGVSCLVSKIRSLHESTNSNEFNKYYKYLQDQCVSPKYSVSSSAITGLIHLTQEPCKIMPLHTVMKDVMSTLATTKNMSAIIDLIFHYLFVSVNTKYDIMKNQHPLITVLKKNNDCWPHILYHIEDKLRHQPKGLVLERIQPFTSFVLYDYEQKLDQVMQLELLNICKPFMDDCVKQKIIILTLTHIPRSLRYCQSLLTESPEMLTYYITVISQLLENDMDAIGAIWMLYQYVVNNPERYYALELVMLAECLPVASVSDIPTLCDILTIMLSTQKYPSIVTSAVKSSLLGWKMHYATTQMPNERISEKIDDILNCPFEYNDYVPSNFEYLNEKPFIYSFLLANGINSTFIDSLTDTSPEILEMLFPFLLAYLCDDNMTCDTLKVLHLCLRACEQQPRFTSRMLPVLLQRTGVTIDPRMHHELLRTLPKMGVLKENLTVVVMTIKAISCVSTRMHAFAISLMLDLVYIDKVCFSYMEELLMKSAENTNTELLITKAYALQEMCKNMATYGLENHRKELTAIVSKALARRNENNTVISLLFEALKYLCRGFDAYATMLNIDARFEDVDNEYVVVGMCGIMGEIAHMPDSIDQRCEDVIKRLFMYGELYPTKSVLDAIYKAVANFTLEQIAVGFPGVYKNITNDNSIIGSLSGTCWVNLLQFGPRAGLQSATELLIHFIQQSYSMAKPLSTDPHEPVYMILTRDNILGAVAKFIKKNSSKLHTIDRDVYLAGLRILSTKYVRPMPPMDWTFLNELRNYKDMLGHVVTIGALQSGVSESARGFCEKLITSITDRNMLGPDVIEVYNNLDLLCNTIQPVIMKPFFRKTLKLGFILMETSHKDIDFILSRIEGMLKNPNVAESNKDAAALVLLDFFSFSELDSAVLEKVLPVVGCVPRAHMNDYSPVQFESVNEEIMWRCVSVHCAVAAAEEKKPFNMLDAVIDCRLLKTCVQPAFNFEKMHKRLAPVFEKHAYHPSLAPWLNELANKMSVELAERKDMGNVIFASSVMIIAVTAGSGYDIFTNGVTNLEEYSAAFPYAMASLLNSKPFAPHIGQILESLYDFTMNPSYRRNALSEQISYRFKQALLLMRAHKSFNEKLNWMKYIEVNR